jgi:NADH:ubiquinone oxidoreductase subunit F (NADH-binding)
MSTILPAKRPTTAAARLLRSDLDGSHRGHLACYGPLPPLPAERRVLLDTIEASGLSGRGGAAFPTALKLAAVADRHPTTVIANGMEGEPASRKDAVLLGRNPHLILDGLVVAQYVLGVENATVAVSQRLPGLERAIREREGAQRPRLMTLPASFIAGEESALLDGVSGRAGKPTGQRPYEQGVLVQNVETLAHLALIARYGADWFRQAGTESEPGTALATVSGAVATAGVLEFEPGATLGELFERCGGLTEPVSGVLIGGYFGSWLAPDPELVLASDALRPLGATLGARAIVALPASVCPLREIAHVAHYLAGQSAGQCGPCVFGLPALADALDTLNAHGLSSAPRDRISALQRQIQRRGGCAHPDGAVEFVASGLRTFAAELDQHSVGRCSATRAAPLLPTGDNGRRR